MTICLSQDHLKAITSLFYGYVIYYEIQSSIALKLYAYMDIEFVIPDL